MATTKAAPGKKGLINFDFLQKLGKVLMTVIAVMPAAGLMISLGKLVQMGGGDIAAVMTIGTTMENIGWAVINNLHILFAVAIGGSWAKERAGGAFAAVLAFALINVITGNIFGVTSAMLADPNAVTHTLFGQEIAVNGYFTSVLGAPALNMGVFVGMAVMLRYIPTIQEDWRYIKDAMRMRDVSPSLASFLAHPGMTVECIYVPLLMAASKAADDLSVASVTRGIENPNPRTCLVQIKCGAADWGVIAVAVAYLIFELCVREGVIA